jgi:hypothetical protein
VFSFQSGPASASQRCTGEYALVRHDASGESVAETAEGILDRDQRREFLTKPTAVILHWNGKAWS